MKMAIVNDVKLSQAKAVGQLKKSQSIEGGGV